MPPVPKIGEVPTTSGESTSTIFSSKKVAESSGDSKLSSNIFASALKQSNVDNKSNIFSAKPSAPGNVIQEMTWRFSFQFLCARFLSNSILLLKTRS